MYMVRKLVMGLIEYLEEGVFPVRPGILRDQSGSPILDIVSLISSGDNDDQSKIISEKAKKLLDICSKGDFGYLDSIINAEGQLDYTLFSYAEGTALMVPSVSEPIQIPYAIIALARMADTGSGDSVAHRIASCEWCGKFFLRKTKKKSRFHNRVCRVKHMNKERLASGYFRNYYIRKRDEKEKAPRP